MNTTLGFFASDLCESPKVHEAAKQCGISPYTLVGYLIHLWGQVLERAPDGDFGPAIFAQLAPADGWPVPHFLLILCRTGLVDVLSGYYAIHDWSDYSGRIHLRRQANTLAVRAHRARQAAEAPAAPASPPVPVPSVDLPTTDVVQLEQQSPAAGQRDLWGQPLPAVAERSRRPSRREREQMACPAEYETAFWQALEDAFRQQGRRMPQSPVEREKWQKTCERFWQDGVTAEQILAVFTIYIRAMRDKIARGEEPYRFTAAALRNNVADWLLPAAQPIPEREVSHDPRPTTIAAALASLPDQPVRRSRGGRADTTLTDADRALLRGERPGASATSP